MSKIQIAKQSVIDIHEYIENVFTQNQPEALAQLFNAFHPDFQMITTTGYKVNLEAVQQLFTSKQGIRTGLKITIEDINVINHQDSTVWLQYKEIHNENGVITSRLSTACVIVENNTWQWIYLHETSI
ncbi:hypothetical protein [Wohlfahrtiimonas populi]|uniref:hypothetical protein n=1 Tax=Wohlfahrtiimonas populi TaxID=1940240 RepID=UPI00098D1A73|nr:hypothetical protein [Wohlfahrtiimonas populi]